MSEPIQHIDGPFTAGCRNDSITFHEEPVYEYRVVCDGHRVTPWIGTYIESVAAATRDRANAACPWRDEEQHSHTIERRLIGPWERRLIGPWEPT